LNLFGGHQVVVHVFWIHVINKFLQFSTNVQGQCSKLSFHILDINSIIVNFSIRLTSHDFCKFLNYVHFRPSNVRTNTFGYIFLNPKNCWFSTWTMWYMLLPKMCCSTTQLSREGEQYSHNKLESRARVQHFFLEHSNKFILQFGPICC
jgi:hypothetical protein